MRVVIGRDLVLREGRVDAAVDVMLIQLADQQRLPVLLDHLVDIVRRSGKKDLGLLQFELFAHPAVDIDLHEGRAVLARNPLRDYRLDIAHLQFAAARPRQCGIAGKIAGQFLATGQEQRSRHDRYFRSQSHNPEDKDTVFTRN